MVRRLFRMICHGTLMMVRNLRSYSMLSLSVVLSFSVLLGYLAISDSTLFNQYKNVIYKPDGWTIVHDDQLSAGDLSALQALTGDAAGGSSYIMCEYGSRFVEAEDRSYNYTFSIYSVPSVTWDIFVPHGIPENVAVSWLDGRQGNGISLSKGEILISRQAYDILFAGETGDPVLPVCVEVQDGGVRWLDCRVVGTLDAPDFFSKGLSVSDVNASMHITVFMSQSTVDEMAGGAMPEMAARWAVYNAKKPAVVVKAAEQLGMTCNSIQELKSNALKEMQIAAQAKMIVVLLLFVLLGINLYGGFSNALDRRRFEVGVKRAIGASKWDIIGQFLWESLLLMACNILAALMLVINGLLIYKYIWEMGQDFSPYHKWTIYMNGTSILMFAVVTAGLTLLFSIVFAVKATQVQVVDHLKAE